MTITGACAQPLASVATSLERFNPDEAPPSRSSAAISAARGEAESFQIIVRGPASGLSNVNVAASALTGPGGAQIPQSSISMFREHYVYVSQPISTWHINRMLGPGWYPDALIPFTDPTTKAPLSGAQLTAVPFNLAWNKNQGIWIDVQVPRGIPAGVYNGTFTVSSNQGAAVVPLALTVWNFDLPAKPTLKSNFNYWRAAVNAAAVYSLDTLRTNQELLRNRLMPATVNPASERSFIDDFGLVNTALPPWSGANSGNCSMSPPLSVSYIQSIVAQHQPDIFLSMNTADEIYACTNLWPTVQAWARNLHAAGVPQLIVMPPTPALFDDGSGTGRSAVDIWVVLPKQYDANPALINQAIQKGDQVWSYNALMQDQYTPKWQIDYAPINYRIQPGFINQSLGLTGLTYWKIDEWTSDPWNNIENINVGGYMYRGEGMLVYPGAQVGIPGVAPSMRLKYLRDGVDDYDYIDILKKLGQGTWALNLSRTVGPDWTNWTRSNTALESVRTQMGQKIDQIMTGGSTVQNLAILTPASGATVSGSIAVTTAVPASTVRAEFYVDNVYKGTVLSSPFSFTIPTSGLSNGPHTLTVVGYDVNWQHQIASIPLTIGSSGATPTVIITSPSNGAFVGASVTVTINASSTISRAEFWLDNVYQGLSLTAPFTFNLNTGASGTHTLTVVGYDSAWKRDINSIQIVR